jgi:pyruvate/2-oxoglutarate dehydrogenase complex dihydrolipoamide dehydrogenase (E3) component
VDEHLRVASGVWAVDDITGQGAFTHLAMDQSAVVVADKPTPESTFRAR